jgi:hypothetical protein
LLSALEQALGWTGFRPLTTVEAASGPFTILAAEHRHVRLDAATCNMAFVSKLESQSDIVRFLDHCGSRAWGCDLNLQNHAHQTEVVNELHFLIATEASALIAELKWFGFEQHQQGFMHVQADCRVPDLGSGYAGEIFPCLGWVLMPGATSEFGPAEQRTGFCTSVVPAGAQANHASRAYQFVYGGYARRDILRRRIIRMIDPRLVANPFMIVEDALSLTYGEA